MCLNNSKHRCATMMATWTVSFGSHTRTSSTWICSGRHHPPRRFWWQQSCKKNDQRAASAGTPWSGVDHLRCMKRRSPCLDALGTDTSSPGAPAGVHLAQFVCPGRRTGTPCDCHQYSTKGAAGTGGYVASAVHIRRPSRHGYSGDWRHEAVCPSGAIAPRRAWVPQRIAQSLGAPTVVRGGA